MKQKQPMYSLVKVLIAKANEPSHNGKVGTPIIGYVLKNLETNELEVSTRSGGYVKVMESGATNVECKSREFEGKIIYYLKPTDGRKINEYMINIEEDV